MNLAPVKIQCTGRLKYSGLWSGMSRWKSGTFVLTGSGGNLTLNIFLSCNPTSAVRTYKLSRESVDRIVCKAHMLLCMKNHDAVSFKAADPTQEKKLQEAVQVIQEMQRFKAGPPGRGLEVWEDGTTPQKKARLSNSPEKFTSVKENPKISKKLYNVELQEESKENMFRGPGRNQEEQCVQRSQALKSMVTGEFYNTPKSYGFYTSGVKRPGLMPFNPQDHAKKPRLTDKVSFSWQSCSVNSQNKPSTALQGFSNLGNTCYMNATLQSLFGLDPFISDMLQADRKIHRLLLSGSLYVALVRLMSARNKLTGSERRKDILLSVKNAVSSTACRFSGNQQHDAHEFLGQVLDQLSEEFNKITTSVSSPHSKMITSTSSPLKDGKKSDTLPNPVDNNFSFEVVHRIKCFNCQEEVSKAESFHDLSLYLPQSSHICMQSAVDDFLKNEELEYTCAKCGHSRSEVTHKFSRLPRILILHVKRYSFNDEISCWSKTRQKILISRFITLAPHCVDSTEPPPAMVTSQLEHLSPVRSFSVDRLGDSRSRHRVDQNVSWKFKQIQPLCDEDSTQCDDTKSVLKQETSDDHLAVDCSEENSEFDKELQKALELSRLESEKNISIGYLKEKDLQKLTEEEQLQLALQNSLVEDASFHTEHSFSDSRIRESETHQALPEDQGANTSQAGHQNIPGTNCADRLLKSDLNISESFKQGGQLSGSNTGINVCKNILNTAVARRALSDRNCNKSLDSLHDNTGHHPSCGISSHTVGIKSQLIDKPDSVNSSNDHGIVKVDLADNHDSVTKEHSCRTESKRECLGRESVDNINSSAKRSLCGGRSSQSDLTCGRESLCNVDGENKNCSATTSGREQIPNDADKEGIELQCFEEKENVLTTQDNFSDWDDDVFNTSLCEVTDQQPAQSNQDGSVPVSYRLVSIVNHIGSSSSAGHYISDVYDMKKQSWFSYDDTQVSRITEADIQIKRQRTGYIFFYMLKDLFEEHVSLNTSRSVVSKQGS